MNKEKAYEIVERLKTEKVIKFKTRIEHVLGYMEVDYLYDSEESRSEHIERMKLEGFIQEDTLSKESLYSNFHDKERIYALKATFFNVGVVI